jgi:DNA-binding LytR/AlgR family response regulator
MNLRTLIVDDEAAARSRLRKLLAAHPDVELIGEAADGVEAVAAIVQSKPDLVFLDVQMPGLTGFEVLQSLPADAPAPLIVFATAYDQYALEAFDANAVSYLLKPINRDRLAQVLERAARLAANPAEAGDAQSRIRRATETAAPPMQQIVARRRDRFLLLPLHLVVLFEVENGTVRVKTGADRYWTDYQINDLDARLPTPPFFRAHRSAIVNFDHVREIAPMMKSTYLLVMNDSEGSEVLVSERQSKRLRQMLTA